MGRGAVTGLEAIVFFFCRCAKAGRCTTKHLGTIEIKRHGRVLAGSEKILFPLNFSEGATFSSGEKSRNSFHLLFF